MLVLVVLLEDFSKVVNIIAASLTVGHLIIVDMIWYDQIIASIVARSLSVTVAHCPKTIMMVLMSRIIC